MENSNIDSNSLDDGVGKKLRGDAVGDTMYSASFITKTLIQLSKVKWSEQLEEDLCFLWDMTLEKDICQYLLDLSYPSLVIDILKEKQENRLIEILIGILANIFCVIQDKSKLNKGLEDNILIHLYSDDPLVIIQVMRFIKAVAFLCKEVDFIDVNAFEQLRFILRSSTNTQLLTNALDTLTKLTDDNRINSSLINCDVIPDMFAGLKEIKKSNDLGSLEVRTAYVHILQTICNILSYENEVDNTFGEQIKCFSDLIIVETSQILDYFSLEENLLPLPNEMTFYAEGLLFIFEKLDVKKFTLLFESICKIIHILMKENYDEKSKFIELFEFMLINGDLKYLQDSVSNLSLHVFQTITKSISTKNEKVLEKIQLIEKSFKQSTPI